MLAQPRARRRGLTLALSVAVLLIAAGFRLWGLAWLPPGLAHDEAFHLVQAGLIARGEALPVYITGNQGNEPLFAYLTAIAEGILGPVNWSGRLTAAVVGILTVALTIRTGNELFPGRRVGLAAGLILAIWYWSVAMSRWGSQPILSAAAAAGTTAFFWRGLRTHNRWAFVLAGVCLAAGLWAYVAFRLFPIVVVLAVVVAWLARKAPGRQLAAGTALAVLVAGALYAPLGYFFFKNPEWFFNRFNQISQVSGAGRITALLENARLELAGLMLPGAGDHDWRQNLAGRPALDLAQAGLLLAGLGLLARRRAGWAPGLVLLAWFGLGLSISVVTEFPPQSGRSVMATPAGALIMGVGLAGLWRWAGHVRPLQWQRPGLAGAGLRGALAAAVAVSGLMTARDYFVSWAGSPALFLAFDTGLAWIGTELRGAPPGARLIETPVDRSHSTFEFSLGQEAYNRFESFNGRECFMAPALTTSATEYAVITGEDPDSVAALQLLFPSARQTAALSPLGAAYARVFEVAAGARAQVAPGRPGDAFFGGIIRLLGNDLGTAAAQAGTELRVPIIWRLEQPTPADLRRFVHVIGPAKADGSPIYAQHDSAPCDNSVPTWRWPAGEIMIETVKVELPADMPPGAYHVFTGWYDSSNLQRLAAAGLRGEPRGDTVELGTIQVSTRGS